MLDLDHIPEDRIHRAIDWCQDDEFWRSNILSMRKLREKYIQLQAAAKRRPGTGEPVATTDRRMMAAQALKGSLRPAQEEITGDP